MDELDPVDPRTHVPIRAGELSNGWTVVFALGWLGVVIGIAAVWGVSRQIGLPVWWIGPKGDPRPLVVSIAVFAPAIAVIAGATARARHLWRWGLLASLALALVAIADLAVGRGGSTGLVVVQVVLALAGAAISLAAWSGTYRPATVAVTTPAGTPHR